MFTIKIIYMLVGFILLTSNSSTYGSTIGPIEDFKKEASEINTANNIQTFCDRGKLQQLGRVLNAILGLLGDGISRSARFMDNLEAFVTATINDPSFNGGKPVSSSLRNFNTQFTNDINNFSTFYKNVLTELQRMVQNSLELTQRDLQMFREFCSDQNQSILLRQSIYEIKKSYVMCITDSQNIFNTMIQIANLGPHGVVYPELMKFQLKNSLINAAVIFLDYKYKVLELIYNAMLITASSDFSTITDLDSSQKSVVQKHDQLPYSKDLFTADSTASTATYKLPESQDLFSTESNEIKEEKKAGHNEPRKRNFMHHHKIHRTSPKIKDKCFVEQIEILALEIEVVKLLKELRKNYFEGDPFEPPMFKKIQTYANLKRASYEECIKDLHLLHKILFRFLVKTSERSAVIYERLGKLLSSIVPTLANLTDPKIVNDSLHGILIIRKVFLTLLDAAIIVEQETPADIAYYFQKLNEAVHSIYHVEILMFRSNCFNTEYLIKYISSLISRPAPSNTEASFTTSTDQPVFDGTLLSSTLPLPAQKRKRRSLLYKALTYFQPTLTKLTDYLNSTMNTTNFSSNNSTQIANYLFNTENIKKTSQDWLSWLTGYFKQ